MLIAIGIKAIFKNVRASVSDLSTVYQCKTTKVASIVPSKRRLFKIRKAR